MLRVQIMVQEERVIRVSFQEILRHAYIFGDVEMISFEAICEPLVSTAVVIQQENANRMTLGVVIAKPKLGQK